MFFRSRFLKVTFSFFFLGFFISPILLYFFLFFVVLQLKQSTRGNPKPYKRKITIGWLFTFVIKTIDYTKKYFEDSFFLRWYFWRHVLEINEKFFSFTKITSKKVKNRRKEDRKMARTERNFCEDRTSTTKNKWRFTNKNTRLHIPTWTYTILKYT